MARVAGVGHGHKVAGVQPRPDVQLAAGPVEREISQTLLHVLAVHRPSAGAGPKDVVALLQSIFVIVNEPRSPHATLAPYRKIRTGVLAISECALRVFCTEVQDNTQCSSWPD